MRRLAEFLFVLFLFILAAFGPVILSVILGG